MNKLYKKSSSLLGINKTNKLIKFFYGDVFTGGENNTELKNSLLDLKEEGLISIADYAREFLTKEEEKNDMNKIIKAYIDSIDTAISVDKNNSIALKVSSFGNIDFLKEMNQIQYDLLLLEENINLNYNELKQIFSEQKLNLKFSEEDIQQIKALFDGKISAYDLSIFKMILEKNLPVLKIIYNAYSWDSKKIDEINEFNLSLGTRLQQVFNHALEKKCLLFIDAEQTYIQNYIDYIVAYYSIQMNKASAVVAQTLQCYLKKHEQNLNKWIQFSKKIKLKLV